MEGGEKKFDPDIGIERGYQSGSAPMPHCGMVQTLTMHRLNDINSQRSALVITVRGKQW
jgi:hypothetical protein